MPAKQPNIDPQPLITMLCEGAEQLGSPLLPDHITKFERYLVELLKWNAVWNLTAIDRPEDVVIKHFLDSLSIQEHVNAPKILDVGTGAGFPGLVLAMVRPDQQYWLLDANSKKIRFLQHMVVTANLQNVKVLDARVESCSLDCKPDVIVARAYARLSKLIEQGRPLLADGGEMKLMKGKYPQDEIQEVSEHLGADAEVKVVELSVPYLQQERHLVSISFPNGQ